MRTILSVLMTITLIAYLAAQAWLAYQLTFTVTTLGGWGVMGYLIACPVLFWAAGRYFLPKATS